MDILVTIPKSFGLARWIDEGDCAGDTPDQDFDNELYVYTLGGTKPDIKSGERVYCCYNSRLIGYAPLVELVSETPFRHGLVRGGNAVAVTIARKIPGFRGFRYRDWDYSEEVPFPEWKELAYTTCPALKKVLNVLIPKK